MDTTAMCEINVDREKMGDIDKEDDSLAIELYRNTMTGQWKEVVKMYEEHKIKAISAKINPSGDTALHVAVSIASDEKAQQLVRVIKDWYDEEVKKINDRYAAEVKKIKDRHDEEVKKINDRYATEVKKISDRYDKAVEKSYDQYATELKKIVDRHDKEVKKIYDRYDEEVKVYDKKEKKEITDILESAVWIKNKEGNTPLHVAASAQRISICIVLIRSLNSILPLGMHNNLGESPLFLAAFHGHKEIFLCLHDLFLQGKSMFSNTDLESIDPAYLRLTDGETILHYAISWEYFDLAFEILDLEPRLACSVNMKGITPLHLLATKPAVFISGFHLGRWKKIIYHCIYVKELKRQEIEELKRQIPHLKLIGSVIEEINDFSETVCFYRKLKAKAQVVIETIKEHWKGRNEDVENPSKSNTTGQSENKGTQVQTELHETHEHPFLGRSCVNTPYLVYRTSKRVVLSLGHYGQNAGVENPSESNVTSQSKIAGSQDWSKAQQLQIFIKLYAINIFNIFYKILSWVILRLGYEDLKKIKEKHVHSVQIVKLLIKHAKDAKFDFSSGVGPKQIMNQQEIRKGQPSSSRHPTTDSDSTTGSQTEQQNGIKRNQTGLEKKKNGRGKGETSKLVNTETPVLLAARNGITKMVEQILEAFPLAINDQSKGKNIVLWAVKNRQPRVLKLLLEQGFVKPKLIHEVDTKENNALHLAAKIGKEKPWLIPGAALQMQWEIKWYEFVKNNLPQHYCYQLNEEGKTPEEIFNETHKDLVKEGGKWLKSTSESCSVVATLIAAVVFPAATTVPGGINDSGMPILVKHPAFTLFAISSLVALCFSIIALFLFLTILTSQYQQRDFRSHVPRKLLLGLTLLFVSIGSMLISFCAGQFFLLKSKLKDMAFPVYTIICLSIILFSIAQFPLYSQLLKVTLKKVPPPSYKVVSL